MTRPIEMNKADIMLRYFRDAKPGVYPLRPDQLEIVRMFWDELHSYTGGLYSIGEDGKTLIKYK